MLCSNKCQWLSGEELTERYCREVLVRLEHDVGFLSMSLNPAVKDLLNKGKIDSAIVPGGCTNTFKHLMLVGINL